MNKKYIVALLLPTLFGFWGCEDNLDTEPDGDIFTSEKVEEVHSILPERGVASVNSVFSQFSQYMPNYDAFGEVERHNDFGYPSIMLFTDANGYDVISDDNGYNWTGNSLEFSDRVYTSYESQMVWNNMYSIIFTSNNVIEKFSSVLEEDDNYRFYLAQGYSARAFSYWVLAQLYQFNYVGHENDLCVPIVTPETSDSSITYGLGRATVQEVYDLILGDLDYAIELLSEAEDLGVYRTDKRYISLAVAYGLRARVNLTMQKWSEAAQDAQSAIDHSDATPASIDDVSKPAFWSADESNWMWGIIIAETDRVVTSGIVNWISHMGSLNFGYAWYSKGKQINKLLYKSIDASDVRKGWWLDENSTSPNLNEEEQAIINKYGFAPYTQVKFAPYKEEVATSTNANDIPLMRIEEMYLILAEAQAMSGGDGATTLENFIKEYRDPDYVCEASSPEDVQKEVFRHRRIELWGEGLNWFDVMRLKTGVDRRGAGYPNATMVFNISPDDPVLLWRIPEAEIQANPGLTDGDNNPATPLPTPVEE